MRLRHPDVSVAAGGEALAEANELTALLNVLSGACAHLQPESCLNQPEDGTAFAGP